MSLIEAVDLDAGCVVWLFTGPTNSDEDYQRYIDGIRRLDQARAGKDGAAIVVVDAGNPAPSSAWRHKIAEASAHLESKPVFALVSTSPIIRGVVTAINWLRPPPYAFTTTANFENARAWCEQKLGRQLPELARLYREVRAQVRAA